MPLPFPVCRVGKIHRVGATTPQSVMGHLTRTRSTPNADPNRTADNVWFVGTPGIDLAHTIRAHLDKRGIQPRSNAVLACDVILSASHTFFTPAGNPESETLDARRIRSFRDVALSFARKQFGSRVVAAVLHLDEYTPHLHVVLVPMITSGEPNEKPRLSARDLFSRERLVALQQAWEDALQSLGVGRRTRRSAFHHVDARQYGGCIAAIKKVDPTAEVKIELPAPRRWESAHTYVARVEPWKVEEERRLRRHMKPLLGLALQGKLLRASAEDGSKLRSRLRILHKAQANHKAHAERLRIELKKHLPPSMSAVAEALKIQPLDTDVSPIAAVMRHKKTDRHHALYFLAKVFGSEAAANVLREDVVRTFQRLDVDRSIEVKQRLSKEIDLTIPGP